LDAFCLAGNCSVGQESVLERGRVRLKGRHTKAPLLTGRGFLFLSVYASVRDATVEDSDLGVEGSFRKTAPLPERAVTLAEVRDVEADEERNRRDDQMKGVPPHARIIH
jgi:hypothetical protein